MKLKKVLTAMLAVEAGDENVELHRLQAEDPALYAEAKALMKADPGRVAFLEQPLFNWREQSRQSVEGTRIGAYRLVRELGRGGMGIVYLAARDDHAFERLVAIKVLKTEMRDSLDHQRFVNERQILANLDHTHIAKLHDGGNTGDGLPFLVMEYVEGMAITQYCDHHRLTLAERLALFQKVCGAVHFAHQNLVVHRDIKPANILVTAAGAPKLLDFGIAKLLQQSTAKSLTQTGMFLTPDYASPEQVRGESVTTASDIYSLGVLLYRLLGGLPPYDLDGMNQAEVREVINHSHPVPPSELLGKRGSPHSGSDPDRRVEGILHQRQSDSRRFRNILKGDLDRIVLKAMRKEAAHRYDSAHALADDIGRYLEGLPIRARRETPVYLMKRMVGRYPVRSGLSASMLLLVFVFSGILLQQRQQMQRERDRATFVSQFMMDVFERADPYREDGLEITQRDLVDKAVARLEDLETPPEVRTDLHHLFGRVYRNMGDIEQAELLLRRVLAEKEAEHGSHHVALARPLIELAWLQIYAGAYGEIGSTVQRARGLLGENPPRPQADLAEIFHLIALGHTAQGQYQEATAFFDKALEDYDAIYGPEHSETATLLNNYAGFLNFQGRYGEAEEALMRALAIQEKRLPDHPFLAPTLMALSKACLQQGKHLAAVEHANRALQIAKDTVGEQHRIFATASTNLGKDLDATGDPTQAEYHYQRSLQCFRDMGTPDHPEAAMAQNLICRLMLADGREAEARDILAELIHVQQQTLGQKHPYLAELHGSLGRAAVLLEDWTLAESALQTALSIRQDNLGPDNLKVAEDLMRLAEFYEQRGQLARARDYCERAWKIQSAASQTSATTQPPEVITSSPCVPEPGRPNSDDSTRDSSGGASR